MQSNIADQRGPIWSYAVAPAARHGGRRRQLSQRSAHGPPLGLHTWSRRLSATIRRAQIYEEAPAPGRTPRSARAASQQFYLGEFNILIRGDGVGALNALRSGSTRCGAPVHRDVALRFSEIYFRVAHAAPPGIPTRAGHGHESGRSGSPLPLPGRPRPSQSRDPSVARLAGCRGHESGAARGCAAAAARPNLNPVETSCRCGAQPVTDDRTEAESTRPYTVPLEKSSASHYNDDACKPVSVCELL